MDPDDSLLVARALLVLRTPALSARLTGFDLLVLGLTLGLNPASFALEDVVKKLEAQAEIREHLPPSRVRELLRTLQATGGVEASFEARYAIKPERWREQLNRLLQTLLPRKTASSEARARGPVKKNGPRGQQKPAKPPPPPPPPPLPPAPAYQPPALVVERPEAMVSSWSCWPRISTEQLRLTLGAYRLAIAQSFDELLAPTVVQFTPHRYQVETARKVLRVLRGRAMLSDEVGLGKTIEAMLVLREYQLRGLVRRTLILAPPPLVEQWVGELAEKVGVEVRTLEDTPGEPEHFWSSEGVLVASMAQARSARHAPLVQAQPWDLVVVDEAHHIKNRTTLGWKLIDGLKSRFLLLLTATPIEKSLDEIYNLVTLLRPGQFKTAQAFRKAYVDPKNPTSPRNREQLRGLLAEVMIRNTRAQSGLRLPPRYVSTVAVDTTPSEQSLYLSVVELLRRHHADTAARLVTSTLLIEAGSSTAALRSTLQKMADNSKHKASFRKDLRGIVDLAGAVQQPSKLRAMEAILAENPGKVLIFTRFRETLLEVQRRLAELGQLTTVFHGGLTRQQKSAALASFREDTRILVASDVGGEGQNLQFCSTLINYDLPWNPMLLEQRIGRLHRMGQEREVRVYNLCARGTAEEWVLDVLDRRVHLFELVVGEMDMVLGNLEDDRDLEERVIDLYAQSKDNEDLVKGFDTLAAELLTARGRYERIRAFDEALFGKDYEA
ncbi:MAG: DEAD/DEAH box helicase [Polyangiaceae bacterium]|jgi:superfamily II DNA or RNA helicase|nr:DEAD/DEAH box helicase [Polyangiaceae bacterium]